MFPFKSKVLAHSVLYALPQLGLAMLMSPLYVLSGIYAKYYGFSLTALAGIVLFSRIFDAVTDPLIGFWSDRIWQRTGSRKHFIGAGGVVSAISAWFLFVPPGDFVSTIWFYAWFFALYLGATLIGIPYMAWVGDIYSEPKDRSLLFSASLAAGQIGTILFFFIPYLPIFDATNITPEVLKLSTLVGIAFLLPGVLLCLKFLPSGPPPSVVKSEFQKTLLQKVRQPIAELIQNKPFIYFVAAFAFTCLANGAWLGLFYIYSESYLGLGSAYAGISLLGISTGAIMAFIARGLITHVGTKMSWLLSMSLLILCYLLTVTLTPAFSNEFLLALAFVLNSTSMSLFIISANTLLCSVADYGALFSEKQNTGSYFATMAFLTKVLFAVSGGMGLAIAGWYGFDASGELTVQSESGIFGLKLAIAGLPLFFIVIAIAIGTKFPLGEKQLNTIQRALTRKKARM